MSDPRARDRGPDREPDPGPEAELLQWLIDPRERRRRTRSELEAKAGGAAPLEELEGFLARCRDAAREQESSQAKRSRALAERVLASTTREDLSWRGDWRLLRGFLAGRLRASPALRVAAASLLIHLLALPVVAWYGLAFVERETSTVRFDPRLPADPYPDREEEAAPVELPPAELSGTDLELGEADGALYVANSRGWARFQIRSGVPSLPSAAGDDAPIPALLFARARTLDPASEPRVPAELAPGPDAPLVERALWCELLLDAHLRDPLPPRELDAALVDLGSAPLPADASGLLAAAALARADSYGALPAGAVDALWQARVDLSELPGARALLDPGGDLRRVAPLDPAWVSALERAAGGAVPGAWIEALR